VLITIIIIALLFPNSSLMLYSIFSYDSPKIRNLPQPFTPDLNSSLSQILSSIVFLVPSGLPSWILTCTELSGHWRLF